ncbi:TIGR01777 family oxidoreductase [Nitriliruptor alkaliphilus]|uniref:TIGR01777 family oxidoreductase n=1 Tax=Nitriliruptor alkaliphilus TaxID=427918 RepID=UPI000A9F98E9|nr:TIGR01777 family oxidoreductase [Nitriliruptor alkaliphilus]
MAAAADDLGAHVGAMRVAITGSTGLIGEALVASLTADGHRVQRVTRSRANAGPDDVVWDPQGGDVDTAALEGVDAVVHLAGEPLGSRRWNAAVKREILASRSVGTRTLAEALASLDSPPAVLVSGSGSGYYGDRGDEVLTEDEPPGDDFVAGVVVAWEAATRPAAAAGIRVACSRTGVVMAAGGALIEKVELPFKLGVGGRVGSGRQYVPWISLPDEVRALRFLIDEESLAGPVNLVAPQQRTNAQLTKDLGAVYRRPTVMPIPLFAVRVAYGEGAVALAAPSQRVVPTRLEGAGFRYEHPELRGALEAALGRRAR